MNAETIRNMEAGRELDALVMEMVMEYKREPREFLPQHHWAWVRPDEKPTYLLPQFSRDIAAAWQVVEKVTEPAPCVEGDELPPNTKFMLRFQRGHLWAMAAEEAAETISKWALLAVMGELE